RGEIFSHVAQGLEVEIREVLRAAKQRRDRRGEAERGRIEHAFVLAHVWLAEALPAGADVPQRTGALRVGMVVGDAVVLAIEEVAAGDDAVHLAVNRITRLAPVVAGVAAHAALLRRDR